MPSGKFFDGPKKRMDRERIILVEGPDDAYFFDAILEDLGASPDKVGVIFTEGKTNLESNISSLLKSRPYVSGVTLSYSIIGDADVVPSERLSEIHGALTGNSQPNPPHGELVENSDGRQVGVFLIPSVAEEGDLEKLCLGTLRGDALLGDCRAFADDIEVRYGAFQARHKTLAAIYLACRPEDTRGVGRAFYMNIFDRDHQSLSSIKQFVAKLIA